MWQGASAVPVQMWQGASPVRMPVWAGVSPARSRACRSSRCPNASPKTRWRAARGRASGRCRRLGSSSVPRGNWLPPARSLHRDLAHPLPSLHWDWARPGHMGTGTRLSDYMGRDLAHRFLQSAPGFYSPLQNRHRAVGHSCTGKGWAGRCHICTGTGAHRRHACSGSVAQVRDADTRPPAHGRVEHAAVRMQGEAVYGWPQ
jgi:hypothetical protein